jgi:hypothetical protein
VAAGQTLLVQTLAVQPTQILTALADLAPARGERLLDVGRGGAALHWIGTADRLPRSKAVDRLAGLDALHRDERILRRGLGFVVGTADIEGTRTAVRLPLLAQPVRLERTLSGYRVVPAGDLELTPLIEDAAVAAGLEAVPGIGSPAWLTAPGTDAWIRTAAQAAGLAVTAVMKKAPRSATENGLVGVSAAGLFVVRDVRVTGVRDTLLAWSRRPGLAETALAAVYGVAEAEDPPAPDEYGELLSPLPLNARQREVVRRVARERVVAVTGPPGNGKSHALVAAALDVVDRGGSVLIAAQSTAAVQALATLLGRYPGPTPVLFGDAEHRDALITQLEHGGSEPRPAQDGGASVVAARDRVTGLRAGIAAALEVEQRAAALPGWEPLLPGLRVDAPAAFEPDFDHRKALRLATWALGLVRAYASTRIAAWWLRRRVGAAPTVPVDRLVAAVDAAASLHAAARLAATGGTDLSASWRALMEAEQALAEAVGVAMRERAARRWGRSARRSATALAAALRAGRNRRRELLAALDGRMLVHALPLWIGTVTDVEDLLPPVPGLFDLVIIDEAVHVDQIRAAPVLARARRALVAGDPRQLRFVSFVADVDVALTLRRHGLDGFADRMDVRRASAFDVAAGATVVTSLVEHYRSAPHLIEFSAGRFYRERLDLMTRHPRNEAADLIDVVRVAGAVDDGVNAAEVDAVVTLVRGLAAAGRTGIGVISPFRSQADALEAALLAAFPVEEIERLGLRSATVHGFQGSEAATVIASFGLADGDAAARVRFVSDPHLFNVLVTRARDRMTVVTSLRSPPGGIVGDYLSHAERGASPVVGTAEKPGSDDAWTAGLAGELRRAGRVVRAGYPVGSWRVDLCLDEGDGAVGLITAVHPDGVGAHVDRQRALLSAGWRLVDAFASRWSGEHARAAVELSTAGTPLAGDRVDDDVVPVRPAFPVEGTATRDHP